MSEPDLNIRFGFVDGKIAMQFLDENEMPKAVSTVSFDREQALIVIKNFRAALKELREKRKEVKRARNNSRTRT